METSQPDAVLNRVPTELIHCFFCRQEYLASVQWIDGILHPALEQQLECPNPECESNSGKPSQPAAESGCQRNRQANAPNPLGLLLRGVRRTIRP
jgi:hypothetical protein